MSLTVNFLTRDLPGRNYGVLTGGTYFYEIGRSVYKAKHPGGFLQPVDSDVVGGLYLESYNI